MPIKNKMPKKPGTDKKKKDKDYSENFIRKRKIGDKVLLVNDYGGWCFQEKHGKVSIEKQENLGIIITKRNINKEINDCYYNKNMLFEPPSMHTILLSCRKKQASEETIKKIIDFIFNSGSNTIRLELRGNPGINDINILKKAVEYSKGKTITYGKSVEFSVCINEVAGDIKNIGKISEEDMNYIINNSFYVFAYIDAKMLVSEDHDDKKTMEVVSALDKKSSEISLDSKKLGIKILIKDKDYSEINQALFIEKCFELGFNEIELINCSKAESFIRFWKGIMGIIIDKTAKTAEKNKNVFIERNALQLIKKIFGNFEYNKGRYEKCLSSPCCGIISRLSYDTEGNIYPCYEAAMLQDEIFLLGNIDTKSSKKIVSSKNSKKFIESSINELCHCDYCAYRPFCGVCPVLNYKNEGSIVINVMASGRCKEVMGMMDYLFERLQDNDTLDMFKTWINQDKVE